MNSILKNILTIQWQDKNYLIRGAKRGYRGRQHTRKKKVVVENPMHKIKQTLYLLKKKAAPSKNAYLNAKEYEDFMQRKPLDNIYLIKKFPEKFYNLKEAIELHQEVACPDMYDNMDGIFNLKFIINMESVKKNKPLSPFSGIIHYKNNFDFPMKFNNRVLALAKNASEQEIALDSGAAIAGGKEIVKKLIKGILKSTEFDHVVCTPEIYPDLTPIRGILGRSIYPHPSKGSVDVDLALLVKKFIKSVSYQTIPLEDYIDYSIQIPSDPSYHYLALIECMLSKIGMPLEHIIQNFETCLTTILSHKSLNQGKFILKSSLLAPPNSESFNIDMQPFENLPEQSSNADAKRD